jgi:nucleoid-associated protein YgaU
VTGAPSIAEAAATAATNSPDIAADAPATSPAVDAALAAPSSAPGTEAPPVGDAAVPAKPAAITEVPAARPPLPAEVPAIIQAPAVVDTERSVAAGPPPVDVPEVTAPKLQNVKSAVIIRRGDTLWRISRRVYGRGIRYSTIYQANRQQIQDPDRIWPGQVFRVPEKSQEGDAADMSKIAKQAITVPEELELPARQ